MIARLLRFITGAPSAVSAGAREALREHVLRETDRVLMGIMEPGVATYGLKSAAGEVIEVSPDTMLAFIGAVRARLRAEL